MNPFNKLHTWRTISMKISMKDLSQNIDAKLKLLYPEGIPRGERIHEADIGSAEDGNFSRFEKVTKAIYQYLGVEEGFFGIPDPYLQESTNIVTEDSLAYRTKIQSDLLEAQNKIIDLQAQMLLLTNENKNLALLLAKVEVEKRQLEDALLTIKK